MDEHVAPPPARTSSPDLGTRVAEVVHAAAITYEARRFYSGLVQSPLGSRKAMRMRRIAVLTTFVHLRAAYSLCTVVESHVRMLLQDGYDTTFVACEGFRPEGIFCDPDLQHWRMPVYLLGADSEAIERYGEYQAGVARIVAALRPLMPRIDVAITHDFAYLANYLAYNQACRQLAHEFPHVTW